MSEGTTKPVSRRTVAKGAAWATPVILGGTAAPAYAASVRKDPGINGWVLNSPSGGWNCRYSLDVDSDPNYSGGTPDGAPFGLYLYDVLPNAVITDARLVYWIIGNQNASVSAGSGHSTCWNFAGRGPLATKADGLQYRPYTFNYNNNCPIDPGNVATDGRLYLGNFHVEFSFTQPGNRCDDVTYWAQRSITIDQYGDGNPEVLTFERRNGTRGPYSGGNARMAPPPQPEGATEGATGAHLA
ncbi:hypothetical protein [Janibacter cremeus]|uniref:Uncharacterized protein n=1 Tax=Janibacter cremeus TaxID=1285192 RepID=A0A852VZA0_9MICO|nr:hypothetical protein [Janibacter cremeus]NYF99045.1 hypothetical protein [Janibacter cremeus]